MRQRFPERVFQPEPLPPERQQALSANVFWNLMDRWQVPTTTALRAIGCRPSERDKNERPDFRLSDDQAKFLSCLLEIELTLTLAELGYQRPAKQDRWQPFGRRLLSEVCPRCDPARAAKVLWRLNGTIATLELEDRSDCRQSYRHRTNECPSGIFW